MLSHTHTFTRKGFHTQRFLHTDIFTHRRFYTQKFLHTESFTHRRFYTPETFTHKRFYTQRLLHTNAFTHREFYTQKFLHTDAFVGICSSSHLLIISSHSLLPSCSLLLFYFSLEGRNPFARNEVRSPKTAAKLRFPSCPAKCVKASVCKSFCV